MPRVKTTRTARFALWALRIYLLILLSLIGIKFVRLAVGAHRAKVAPPPASAAGTAVPSGAATEP